MLFTKKLTPDFLGRFRKEGGIFKNICIGLKILIKHKFCEFITQISLKSATTDTNRPAAACGAVSNEQVHVFGPKSSSVKNTSLTTLLPVLLTGRYSTVCPLVRGCYGSWNG